jgi:pimeloyl-[acyl-carrier protein] methyl ester esterase
MSELYVEVNGSGPDLVLLHGWGLNVRVWDGLVAELRDRFRLIAVDLPGHGKSPWTPGRNTPAEQAWLLHSTLAPISNRYSLLGWSLGGQIALDLAAAMPAQIDKLVLVATTPRFTAAPDWPYGMKVEVITKMAAQLREDYQRTVRDFLDLQVRGSVDGISVIEQMRHALSVHGEAKPEALEAGLNTLATSDLRATLPHVRTPTLVIAGQNDRITAPGASQVLAATLPDARYVEMRRAAHAPFLSHRKEFTVVLEQFLRAGDADAAEVVGNDVPPMAAHSATQTAGGTLPTLAAATRAETASPGTPLAASVRTHAASAAAPHAVAVRPPKKKRMKARARKKLQMSKR